MPSNLLRARWGDAGVGISDSAARLLTRYQLPGTHPPPPPLTKLLPIYRLHISNWGGGCCLLELVLDFFLKW